MKKPASLRARFEDNFPDLKKDPQLLRMWVAETGGVVRCHAGPIETGANLNFTVEYVLSVVFEGWRRSPLLIWIILCDWLREFQPELLTVDKSKDAIPFELDIISKDEVDIGFDIKLTEPVRATRREDNGYDMQVIAEPPLEPVPVPLTSIWADGVQLVPDDPFD